MPANFSEIKLLKFFTYCFWGFVAGTILFPTVIAAEQSTVIKATPAFWSVDNGENQGKVYMLGSFHLLPKSYQWYEGKIGEAFAISDELVMEVDMTPDATAEVQVMIMNNGFFRDDDNLRNHLDDAHYTKMLHYAESFLKQREPVAKKMKPWMMAISLSVVAIMSTGMDPNSGVDKVLQTKAILKNKPISGLETVKTQMQALMEHPLGVQVSMLNETIDQLEDIQKVMDESLKAWRTGDEKTITERMVNDLKGYPGLYDALLVKRNNSWITDIEKHITSGKNIFIVVGAAHLVGSDGIVKILKDLGYTVNRIQ
ncbi:MAG: TraB/GumN family protein [Nitrospinales bacterium]